MDGIRPSYFRLRVESTFSMRNQFLVIFPTAGSFFLLKYTTQIHKVDDTVLLNSMTFSHRVIHRPPSKVLIKRQISSFQFF